MQDIITKEIIVKAKKEKVYAAITDPAQVITWFPDIIEGGTLEAGQRPIFIFTEENHKSQIYVEAAKPFEYFAYRWVPGAHGMIGDVLTVPNTLVEFFIEDQEEGTKVTVKESGFASLPAEVAQTSFNQNSGGWTYMLGRLETLINND
ncbi:SRPBCC domain-containing protein [Candidatus Parcubacteria bacterium]|nr:SRPBCC domain-containing protein [Candidatus Parcubacteria bacterium]